MDRLEKPPKCEICDGREWSLIYENLSDRLHHGQGKFSFWRCDSCRVGRTWPTPVNIEDYYPQDYYAYGKKAAAKRLADSLKISILTASWRMRFYPEPLRTIGTRLSSGRRCVDEVSKYAPGPSFRLLDVGCGSGFFLRTLKRIGVTGSGIELSAAGAAETRESGFACHCGPIETAPFPKAGFDVVRFSHVLEHVQSPRSTLASARELLPKGGKIAIYVPNAESIGLKLFGRDWWALEIPRHLWHFGPDSLSKLLAKCGFEILSLRTPPLGNLHIDSLDYRLQSIGCDSKIREEVSLHTPVTAFNQISEGFAKIGHGDLIEIIGVKS